MLFISKQYNILCTESIADLILFCKAKGYQLNEFFLKRLENSSDKVISKGVKILVYKEVHEFFEPTENSYRKLLY